MEHLDKFLKVRSYSGISWDSVPEDKKEEDKATVDRQIGKANVARKQFKEKHSELAHKFPEGDDM